MKLIQPIVFVLRTAIVLFGIITIKSCKTEKTSIMKKEQYIAVEKNIKLFVETYGKKGNEACLFISGAGANSSFWSDDLCNKLAKNGFFVIKYDHRDIGLSSKVNFQENPFDLMTLTKDAVGILDSFEIEKAHVIGHSMGGFISQLMAIHFPERVQSLISCSASTNSPTIPAPPSKTWEIFLKTSPNNNFRDDLPGFLEVWEYLNGTASFDQFLAIKYTKNIYMRQKVVGALGISHVKAQANVKDRSESLKNVMNPALIIHGEEDYLVDKYGGIQTANCIPNAQLVIIPQMGHMPFNKEILERFENEIIHFIIQNKKKSQ